MIFFLYSCSLLYNSGLIVLLPSAIFPVWAQLAINPWTPPLKKNCSRSKEKGGVDSWAAPLGPFSLQLRTEAGLKLKKLQMEPKHFLLQLWTEPKEEKRGPVVFMSRVAVNVI